MYEDLIARLRKMSKISAGLSVLLPKAGGDAMTELLEEAADALEKEGNLTTDVRPVVRSHWKKNDNGTYSCERCHSWIPEEQWNYANWCLYCGADMREDKQ